MNPAIFQGQDTLHGHVCPAEANRPSTWVWQQMPWPAGLQAAGPNEHASRCGRQGAFHQHSVLPGQSQPADFHALHGWDGPGRPRAETNNWPELALHKKGRKAGLVGPTTCRYVLTDMIISCIDVTTLKKHTSSLSETGPSKLTVGKIFGGMLILENWKLTRFTQCPHSKKSLVPVRLEPNLGCIMGKLITHCTRFDF